MKMNKCDQAFQCLEKGLKFRVPLYEGKLYRSFGDYYRELGAEHFALSKQWYEKAIKTSDKMGRRLELARDRFKYGKLLLQIDAKEEASKQFSESLKILKSFGAVWDLDHAEANANIFPGPN